MPARCCTSKRAADAALDQAAAQYRAAVILACQNVADTLRALQADADALKASAEAERGGARRPSIWRNGSARWERISAGRRAERRAEPISRRSWRLVQAQANRYADTAALFQALGGGWWNRTEEPRYERPGPAGK